MVNVSYHVGRWKEGEAALETVEQAAHAQCINGTLGE